MGSLHAEVEKIRNPQVVELIRTFTYRGQGSHRREIVQFHSLDGKYVAEYDPAICPACRDYGDQIVLFCTSDHK